MKPEGHLNRAREIQRSLERLLPDPEGENVAAIVELCYGIAQQLIAYGTETKYGVHKETHINVPHLLREHDAPKIAELFEELDRLRAGRWYGSKGNGEVVRQCLEKVAEIEKWATR